MSQQTQISEEKYDKLVKELVNLHLTMDKQNERRQILIEKIDDYNVKDTFSKLENKIFKDKYGTYYQFFNIDGRTIPCIVWTSTSVQKRHLGAKEWSKIEQRSKSDCCDYNEETGIKEIDIKSLKTNVEWMKREGIPISYRDLESLNSNEE